MRFVTGTIWLAVISLFLLSSSAAIDLRTHLSTCAGDLSTPGGSYVLDQNVSGYNLDTGSCFRVTADNIILDCGGYALNGIKVNESSQIDGIDVSGNNVTVTGCEVANYSYGINVEADLATIKNNTIHDIVEGAVNIEWVDGDNATIFNNTIYSAYYAVYDPQGHDFLNASFNSIRDAVHGINVIGNNTVISFNSVSDGIEEGISWSRGWNGTVSNNTLYNCTLLSTSYGGAIQLYQTHNAIVSGNNASFGQMGIDLLNTFNSVLRNNVANNNSLMQFSTGSWHDDNSYADIDTSNTANGEPIYYWYNASNLVIEGLSLTSANTSDCKIFCGECRNVTIRNSVFSNNMGGGYAGVCLASANDSLVYNNTFEGNDNGVFFTGGANTLISSNRFSSNGYGISIEIGSNTTVSANNFTSQTTAAVEIYSSEPDYTVTGTRLQDNYGSGNAVWFASDGDPEWWGVVKDGIELAYYGVSSTGPVESNIYLGIGVIAVNSSANPALNTSATVTLSFSGACPATLYYYGDYATDLGTIMAGGHLCNETSTPSCTSISCSSNTVTFTVEHFDSYGAEGTVVPEFPGLTALAAIALAGAGYALVGKRKRA
ncbi:MAG: right-handed parallel beta-helix repeat-containing protein [Candidatus Micrarchaeota archaeon]|nr:right-handed parallel beta-helix repeat-containing protein [Candidatus Micrarchaeota archaeon]